MKKNMELYTWEYEGRKYYGFMRHGRLWGKGEDDVIEAVLKSEVSNLRPAKVVDAASVVLFPPNVFKVEPIGAGVYKVEGTTKDIGNFSPVTKTYLTTEQFIKVWKSLDDAKIKKLSAARYAAWSAARYVAWSAAWSAARSAAWYAAWDAAWDAARPAAWDAARYADLAVLVKDKITTEQFEILTKPWTSCGLSLFAEDWDEVLNPPVTEPTGIGAIVEASLGSLSGHIKEKWVLTGTGWVCLPHGYKKDWSDLINPTILSEGLK